MKKYFLAIVLIGLPVLARAFPNEPDGFRGMPWWRNVEQADDIDIFQKGEDFQYGYRRNEPTDGEMFELEKIVYCFYKDKFFAAYIQARGWDNAELLRRDLLYKYGPWTDSRRKFELYWRGKVAEIAYRFDPKTEFCQAVILSKEILDRIDSVNKTWPLDENGYFIDW